MTASEFALWQQVVGVQHIGKAVFSVLKWERFVDADTALAVAKEFSRMLAEAGIE